LNTLEKEKAVEINSCTRRKIRELSPVWGRGKGGVKQGMSYGPWTTLSSYATETSEQKIESSHLSIFILSHVYAHNLRSKIIYV
jgi:hypothetical protein